MCFFFFDYPNRAVKPHGEGLSLAMHRNPNEGRFPSPPTLNKRNPHEKIDVNHLNPIANYFGGTITRHRARKLYPIGITRGCDTALGQRWNK